MTYSNQAQRPDITDRTQLLDPGLNEVAIELDPSLSVIENARHYYKLYSKAKRSRAIVESLIQSTWIRSCTSRAGRSYIDSSFSRRAGRDASELADQGPIQIGKRRRQWDQRKVFACAVRLRDGIRIPEGTPSKRRANAEDRIPNIWLHERYPRFSRYTCS